MRTIYVSSSDVRAALRLKALIGRECVARFRPAEHPLGLGFLALEKQILGLVGLTPDEARALGRLNLLAEAIFAHTPDWEPHAIRLADDLSDARECLSIEFELQVIGFALAKARDVSTLLRYLVFEIAWSAQILLIDAPPGTGEELQVIARELPLAGAIFVTTPQDLAQMDAERTLTVFSENGVPVIGVVYNMSSMTCPHCKQEIDLFARSGRLATELPLLAHIPFDVQLSKAADSGRPLVLGDPKGPIAFEFAKLGALVRRWLAEVPESDRQVTTP